MLDSIVLCDASAVSAHSITDSSSSACLNCGSATSGNFCHQCGQSTHAHVPSALEFLHEFIAHYVALEGKLWRSLGYLIFKPGFLTRAYIEGKRVRFLEPLRLYLTFSILFFAVLKLSPINFGSGEAAEVLREFDAEMGQQVGGKQADPVPNTLPAAKVAEKAVEAAAADAVQAAKAKARAADPLRIDIDADLGGMHVQTGNTMQFRDKVAALAAKVNPAWEARVHRFFDLPGDLQREAFKRAFFGYTPYAIFALMPVFALFLKLLYLGTGRLYGEHFLFALHTNAFAYLMLGTIKLIPSSVPYIGTLLGFWLVAYLPVAMRRVYGGSRFVTGVRWIVLMALHLITVMFAVLLAMSQALLG